MTDQKLPATVDANYKRRIREDLIELRGRVTKRLERIDAPGYTMTDADKQEDADILRELNDLELRLTEDAAESTDALTESPRPERCSCASVPDPDWPETDMLWKTDEMWNLADSVRSSAWEIDGFEPDLHAGYHAHQRFEEALTGEHGALSPRLSYLLGQMSDRYGDDRSNFGDHQFAVGFYVGARLQYWRTDELHSRMRPNEALDISDMAAIGAYQTAIVEQEAARDAKRAAAYLAEWEAKEAGK